MAGLSDLADCVDRFGSAAAKAALQALLHTDPRRQPAGSIYPELGPSAPETLDLPDQVEHLRQHMQRIDHRLIVIQDRLRGIE